MTFLEDVDNVLDGRVGSFDSDGEGGGGELLVCDRLTLFAGGCSISVALDVLGGEGR